MTKNMTILSGIGLGAGLMYFLDPDRGRRRRAAVRDRMAGAEHNLQREMEKAGRDIQNRASGLAAEGVRTTKGLFIPHVEVDDSVLEARVRSRIGHAVRHPHAISVTARYGEITVSGDVLAEEESELLEAASTTPGVASVRNRLRVHLTGDGISSLQGEGKRRSGQQRWTPALRVLAGCGGGVLALYGIARRGLMGTAAGLAGTAVLARATANQELKQVAGLDDSPSVDIQKTVHINAPVKEVFEFLSDFTNLPRFMAHLREVQDLGDGTYHWEAFGPAGVPVAWDAEITKLLAENLVEWRSLPGSSIVSHGSIRFDPDPDNGTRLTVRLSYSPPAGVIGHTVASLVGVDPKHEMDDDFMRLKSLFETGRTRVRGAAVTLSA